MTTDTRELIGSAEDTHTNGSAPELSAPALAVLYGSQTGNAEFLAAGIVDTAKRQGFAAELLSLDALTPEQAAQKDRLLIVSSTHDNGHMPDNAQAFWDALQSASTPVFEDVPFAVLAIGDSMYEDFCKAGADLDTRIGELGGERIVDRIDCDVDYDFTSGPWIKVILDVFMTVTPRARRAQPGRPASQPDAAPMQAGASRHTPGRALVVGARQLSAPDAAKEVWHYELEAEGDGMDYRPGDSLAVVPHNPPDLVDAVLHFLGLGGEEVLDGHGRTVRTQLAEDFEIRLPHVGLVAGLAQRLDPGHPVRRLLESGERETLEDWLWGRDLLDVLREAGAEGLKAAEVLAMLRPLQHRAYSISSSPRVDGARVHLTVSTVRYEERGRAHRGACSAYLRTAAQSGAPLKVFPLPAHEFHVPNDGAADVVMIGPGVGIAPFRGFLRDREAIQATGRNWLFFGDQHREPFWLYEDEMEAMCDRGVLDRLSLAFSRDQPHKVYVQDRMLEEGRELFSWLKGGAFVFVCGDKRRMAPDIDRAMVSLVSEHGSMSESAAKDFVQELKDSGRYVKDVY